MRIVAIGLIGAAAIVAVGAVTVSARPVTPQQVMAEWTVANDACQGNSANTQNSPQCKERDRIQRRAEAMGWCWAYSDWEVPRTDYRWHHCSEARPV